MIAFPAAAALIAALCAAFVGWDAFKRPRPERVAWAIAFIVFAIAACSEVIGFAQGWSPALARIYYLAGAVLVVGILALGELYLLLPRRMPTYAPGLSLLVVAVAATTVWTAPIDQSRLPVAGWHALERGPFLVALAASINAGGTIVLVGGALYSAWKLISSHGSSQRAAGCILIAAGTFFVALGGTLTRFGRPEYLYLAMSSGIAVIFAGVLLTRASSATRQDVKLELDQEQRLETDMVRADADHSRRVRILPLPSRQQPESRVTGGDEGIRFIAESVLPLADTEIEETCRRWSAADVESEVFSRLQARQVWALRLNLPESARPRFDALPFRIQAQLAEIYAEVWSGTRLESRDVRGA